MMRAERLDASLFPFFISAELRLALGGFGARIIDRFNALCAQEFRFAMVQWSSYPVVTVVEKSA
jgi:hypothetical protein